jgi:hypothetical protein
MIRTVLKLALLTLLGLGNPHAAIGLALFWTIKRQQQRCPHAATYI